MSLRGLPCKDCGNTHDLTGVHCGQRYTPYCCPICLGRGEVLQGFYSANMDGVWAGTSIGEKETCRSCQGTGVLWR